MPDWLLTERLGSYNPTTVVFPNVISSQLNIFFIEFKHDVVSISVKIYLIKTNNRGESVKKYLRN